MTEHDQFSPIQFSLDPSISGASLDKEVASIIANTVYDRNNQGNAGHCVGYYDSPVVVHLDEEGTSMGSFYNASHTEAGLKGVHLYLGSETAKEEPNQAFATETQKALDLDERLVRMGLGGTALSGSVALGLPIALTGFAVEQTIFNPGEGATTLLGFSAATATAMTLCFGPAITRNLYRGTITNPRFNRFHLKRSAEHVAKLGLAPVVTFNA